MNKDNKAHATEAAPVNDKPVRRLSPLNNVVFACIFENKQKSGKAMLELLNAILTHVGEKPVKEIISMHSEYSLMGQGKAQKFGRLDVKVRGESNRIFDIEVQLTKDYMNERGYFYGSMLGAKELEQGVPYNMLPEVRVINIADFHIRKGSHNIVEPVMLTYRNEPVEKATDAFIMYHIQLPEFRKRYATLGSVKDDPFLTWIYMLDQGYKDAEEMEEISEMTEGMRNFAEQYGIAINDPDLEAIYNMYWESVTDEASRLAYAKEEGIEQGALKQTCEIAKRMRDEGIDIDIISRTTGLSKEEIVAL